MKSFATIIVFSAIAVFLATFSLILYFQGLEEKKKTEGMKN